MAEAAVIAAVFCALFTGHHPRENGARLGLTRADLDKFDSLIDVRSPDECWPWRGNRMTAGYGRMKTRGRTFRAHRTAFQLVNGPVDATLDIDHQCHNRDLSCRGGDTCRHRACCNPFHLEAVSPAVNTLRGRGRGAENARKSHCVRGHEFTAENTQVMANGSRRCRTCAGLTGRGQGWEATKTHCKRGHPFDEANTARGKKGERLCRACHRLRSRLAYHATKEAI